MQFYIRQHKRVFGGVVLSTTTRKGASTAAVAAAPAADTRTSTIVVAASNSLDPTLAPLLYRCTGVADHVEMNAALVAAESPERVLRGCRERFSGAPGGRLQYNAHLERGCERDAEGDGLGGCDQLQRKRQRHHHRRGQREAQGLQGGYRRWGRSRRESPELCLRYGSDECGDLEAVAVRRPD